MDKYGKHQVPAISVKDQREDQTDQTSSDNPGKPLMEDGPGQKARR